ncbi:hypothetical protein R3P38DRAFT_2512493, partial [Favolaschia claudopus]
APTLSTFSIAAFDSCAGWTWTCLDRTFPPNLPRLGYGMQATLIDNSAACVLLTGGWPFDLSNANMVLFDLSSLTMRSVGVTSGKFPKTVAWHVLGTITDSMPSGVILTTWVPYAGGNGHLVPEIWLYVPAPIAQIRCADLRGRLWHLELDIDPPRHHAIVVSSAILRLTIEEFGSVIFRITANQRIVALFRQF